MCNIAHNLQFFIVTVIVSLAECQVTTTLTKASLEYDGVLGIGWGVFACILAVILGVLCCIYGVSTLFPGLFIAIGFCIPITTLIFMALVPLDQPGNLNEKDNTATNSFIVVKWFYFTIMLVSLFLLMIPLCKIWNTMLIPQRVDSRAQREYNERIKKIEEFEKQKAIDNNKNNVVQNNAPNDVAIPVERGAEENNLMLLPKGTEGGERFDRKQRLLGLRRTGKTIVGETNEQQKAE